MQGRTDFEVKCDEVNSLLEKVALCDATPPSEIYPALIKALNDLTQTNLRALYRQRLSDALSLRIKKAVISKNKDALSEEKTGLEQCIKQVAILQGSGGMLGFSKQKTAVKAINALIEKLETAVHQPKAVEVGNPKALFKAAKKGDLEKVKDLIAAGVEIDCQDAEGRTPLFWAAGYGRVNVVEFLISQKANVNQVQNESATPLYIAACGGHASVVQILLQNNADVNQARDSGATPLYIASNWDHASVVQILLQNNADVNLAKKNGMTPLYAAMYQGYLSVVERLVANRANLNAVTELGQSPLGVAIKYKRDAVVAFLLKTMIQKAKPLVDDLGQPVPLSEGETIYSSVIAALNKESLKQVYANEKALRGKIRAWLVEALTEKTSTVERDPKNIEAELDGLRAMIEKVDLLKGGGRLGREKRAVTDIKRCIQQLEAALNERKAVEVDPSKALFEAAIEGDLEKVKVLIEKGVDVNCQDELGRTPLYRAAGRGQVAIVKFLIDKNANVNLAQNEGATPLYIAAQNGHVKVVQLLLENNADVNQAWKGTTPLATAVVNNDWDIMDLFEEHLNKKIRSHLFEEKEKLAAAPQCYNNLIAYLNHQYGYYKRFAFIRKATRLFLTTALHERVNYVMTHAEQDGELLKNEKAGLDLMIKSLELLQPTGIPPTKKHAMKEIEGWSAALRVKIEHPDLAVTIDPPRAQKKSLTGAMYATLFGGSAPTPQVDSEQAIVPSGPDGSAQAFYNSL